MTKLKGYEEQRGIFVKSIPDHAFGLNGRDKQGSLIVKQTTENIFETMELQPNTHSFGLKERICFSHLFGEGGFAQFKDSYRNCGIAFTYRDGDQADLFFPCDLLALSSLNDLPKSKQELFSNLQHYYDHKIIKRWNHFGTDNINSRLERMHFAHIIAGEPLSYEALIVELVNSFRESSGYKPLSLNDHNRLVSHNECIKFTPVKINILGVFGNNPILNEKATKYWIPTYESTTALMKDHTTLI